MADLDYYELLDVAPTASAAEIREAYRRAVRTAHPDVGGTSGMFRLLTVAYETLSDPARRADYDAGLGRSDGRPPGDVRAEPRTGDADPDPGDAGWGEETSWDAGAGRQAAAAERTEPQSWVHGRRGLVTLVALGGVAAVLFVLGTLVLLYDPGFLRPADAGDDLLSWYAGQPVIRLVMVLGYVLLVITARSESAQGLMIAHGLFAMFLLAWPIAYWDIASGAERWTYAAGVALWLVYNAVLVGGFALLGSRNEARAFEDAGGSARVSDLTRWARGDAGARAVWIGRGVLGATFLFVAVVLVFAHGLIRPAAAGPDALDIALRYPIAVAVIVAGYGYLAYISVGHRSGLELLYLPVAIGLLAWPLAYWDIASNAERRLFGLVAFAWVLHVGALYATSSLIDRRRPEPEWTR